MKRAWCFKNEVADVEALVEKAVGLTGAAENKKLRSVRTANGVLMFAADYLLSCRRLGLRTDDEPTAEEVARVLVKAKSRLFCSTSDYMKLLPSKRAGLRSVVYAMLLCYRDEARVSEHERQDNAAVAEALPPAPRRGPLAACAIDPSEALEGPGYEVLVGTGALGWHEATLSGKKWHTADTGVFLAYGRSVTAVRIPAETIRRWVTSNLENYALMVPAAGEETADATVREHIRLNADLLIYGATYEKPMAADAERSESWWRVHDAILRGYLRFRIHLDVDGPDLPAAA
jgi:hypothetical protein